MNLALELLFREDGGRKDGGREGGGEDCWLYCTTFSSHFYYIHFFCFYEFIILYCAVTSSTPMSDKQTHKRLKHSSLTTSHQRYSSFFLLSHLFLHHIYNFPLCIWPGTKYSLCFIASESLSFITAGLEMLNAIFSAAK